MAERNEEVMQLVARELEAHPDADLQELFEKAKSVDSSIGELTLRQFHARYPLQVKRVQGQKRRKAERQRGTPRTRRPRSKKAVQEQPSREAVRTVFLDFASDFAQADSRSEIVRVLSNVDEYVTRVEKLLVSAK